MNVANVCFVIFIIQHKRFKASFFYAKTRTYSVIVYRLLLARTGINPKKNSAIGEFAENIEVAIEQEKKINEDIHQCKGQITCNIGRIIDEIRKDDGK